MKVLAVAVAASGHVDPILPLARALLAQGHEVVVACRDDPGGSIARTGVQHVKAGRSEMEWFETLRARVRGIPGDGNSRDPEHSA